MVVFLCLCCLDKDTIAHSLRIVKKKVMGKESPSFVGVKWWFIL